MYTDLPPGINLVEDPSFESGIALWSNSHAWLPGTAPIIWSTLTSGTSPQVNLALRGKHTLYVAGASPLTPAGYGGVWYDLGVLPEGYYTASASIYFSGTSPSTAVKFRGGRANDVSAPPIIGSTTTVQTTWQTLNGNFFSDGVNPSMLLIRNEDVTTNYAYFSIDAIACFPAESSFQMDLYRQMAPVADQDAANGYALKRFLRAYSLMFDQVETYIRDSPDGTPGWGTLANPMTAPAETLDWLSQLGGVSIPKGITTSDKRTRIRDARQRERGTRNAIIRSAQGHLDGTKYVAFHERTTDDNHFGVGVLKSESPTTDWTGNLVTNPSVETDLTNWSSTGGGLTAGATIDRDPLSPYDGNYSVHVAASLSSFGTGVWYDLGVLPAGQYQFMCFMRCYGPGIHTNIDYGLAGAELNINPIIAGSWTLYGSTTPWTSDGVTPSRIRWRLATIQQNWIDALMVAQTTVPLTSYVTGGTTFEIKNAVEEERPVGFFQDNPAFLESPWSLWAMESTIIATVSGIDPNGQPIIDYQPVYPSYFDLAAHFTTYDDLKIDRPHDWANLLAVYHDPNNEKTVSPFFTSLGGSRVNGGGVLSQDTGTVFKDSTAGRLVTNGATANQGFIFDLQSLGIEVGKTYTFNIFLRAITTAAPVEVWAGPLGMTTDVRLYQATIPTGAWTQVTVQFVAQGSDYITVLVAGSVARTVNFDMYALTPGTVVFSSNPADY